MTPDRARGIIQDILTLAVSTAPPHMRTGHGPDQPDRLDIDQTSDRRLVITSTRILPEEWTTFSSALGRLLQLAPWTVETQLDRGTNTRPGLYASIRTRTETPPGTRALGYRLTLRLPGHGQAADRVFREASIDYLRRCDPPLPVYLNGARVQTARTTAQLLTYTHMSRHDEIHFSAGATDAAPDGWASIRVRGVEVSLAWIGTFYVGTARAAVAIDVTSTTELDTLLALREYQLGLAHTLRGLKDASCDLLPHAPLQEVVFGAGGAAPTVPSAYGTDTLPVAAALDMDAVTLRGRLRLVGARRALAAWQLAIAAVARAGGWTNNGPTAGLLLSDSGDFDVMTLPTGGVALLVNPARLPALFFGDAVIDHAINACAFARTGALDARWAATTARLRETLRPSLLALRTQIETAGREAVE